MFDVPGGIILATLAVLTVILGVIHEALIRTDGDDQ